MTLASALATLLLIALDFMATIGVLYVVQDIALRRAWSATMEVAAILTGVGACFFATLLVFFL